MSHPQTPQPQVVDPGEASINREMSFKLAPDGDDDPDQAEDIHYKERGYN